MAKRDSALEKAKQVKTQLKIWRSKCSPVEKGPKKPRSSAPNEEFAILHFCVKFAPVKTTLFYIYWYLFAIKRQLYDLHSVCFCSLGNAYIHRQTKKFWKRLKFLPALVWNEFQSRINFQSVKIWKSGKRLGASWVITWNQSETK